MKKQAAQEAQDVQGQKQVMFIGNDRKSAKTTMGRPSLPSRGHPKNLMQMRNNFVDIGEHDAEKRLNTDVYSESMELL